MLLQVQIVITGSGRGGAPWEWKFEKAAGVLIMSLHVSILYLEVSSW